VASLEFAGDSGSLSDINATQGEFRSQIAALNDLMRQLAGNAAISAGSATQADPINAPFTLYVNPYTGSDEFVGGAYNNYDAGTLESKIKRLEKQRLVCGFSPQRPFRTINRAVIEAAIITSKDWLNVADPSGILNTVSIVLSPGVHTLYNDPGQASTSITNWGESKDPTTADLIKFNPATVGGVLLPRGCSLCGPDLRKTTIRPNWVPAVADEAADYSNRHGMLKITGTGYFFGFTVMDKIGLEASHHLLDAFHFASESELDDFYAKTFSAVGTGADLGAALTVTKSTEYQIVGPIDRTQSPTSAWDTTSSASPYIFNCSIRSNYGIGGAFMDGSKVEGLKSMVCANFTGVSLQKDMDCWQRYSGGTWTTATYEQYISTDPDDIRMNPARVSRHISAINDAFIQEVSVFAIGQGVHHFTDLGGEITVTNSNSSFGGCAAISKGYKSFPFPQDENWSVSTLNVPLNVSEKTGNIRRIYLGTVSAITSSLITLEFDLAVSTESSTVPAILLADGYTLKNGTKVWVENPTGDDWQTDLNSSAWSSSSPDEINVSGALEESDSGQPAGTNPETGESLAVGKRVYIRRLVDTRTPSERRVSLQLSNTGSTRLPERNFVVQTDPDRAGGAISREFTGGGSEVFVVGTTGVGTATGVSTAAEVTLRRSAPTVTYRSAGDTYYRTGTVVRHNNKHYQAKQDHIATSANPDLDFWGETFVHMASDYNTEDNRANGEAIIVFDTDTDASATSTTLGINFTTVWTSAGNVRDQYRSSTDYLGVHAFLVALGFSDANAHASLVPQTEANRELDPNSDLTGVPSSGAASGLGNWAIEFRRPSILRLYGHAWEWAGFLNYSKSIPAAQKELGPQNKFTYYFTNEDGGRVVPQGSNEDGFNISPRGLEDIETGATLSVDQIGSSTIDQFQNTSFESLDVTGTATINSLVVTNSIDFPDTSRATTETNGVVSLADAEQLRSSSIISGANDAQRNEQINQSPDVVTLKGLNYWARSAGVVTRRPGVTTIWVVPDNAVEGGTYTFNGTSVTLTEDPNRTGANLTNITPEASNRAVKLSRAVEYGNGILSTLETATYRLANGPYYTSASFNHIANVVGSPSSFSQEVEIADYRNAGTSPNTNVKNLQDTLGAPCFATPITIRINDIAERTTIQAVPYYLRFNEGGSIDGICWTSVDRTLADDTNFPSSIFTGSSYRTANKNSLQDYLDSYINEVLGSDPDAQQIDKFYGWPNVYVQGTFAVKNTIFGAKAPGRGSVGYGRLGPSIFVQDDCDLSINGVYLLGNTILQDLPLSEANSNITIVGSNTYGIKNSQGFIGGRTTTSRAVRLSIQFPSRTGINTIGQTSERNIDINCVHVLDNNGNYGLMANRAATNGTRGATFDFIIGDMSAGSFVYSGGYTSYYINFTFTGHYSGFAGVFGDYASNTESGSGPVGISKDLAPINLYRFNSYHGSLWQQASPPGTTGSAVRLTYDSGYITPSSLGPGEYGQAYEDSEDNALNIQSYVYKQGIDVTTANLVGGALESGYMYG
jgi:hypothetical protein